MTNAKRARYTLAFKQEAVRLVESGQSMAAAGRSLGVVEQTVVAPAAAHPNATNPQLSPHARPSVGSPALLKALRHAVEHRQFDFVPLLLAHGADLKSVDLADVTPGIRT